MFKIDNTVRVGVGVIITCERQILLAKRKNSHGDGSWTTPGGHLELSEKVVDCAIREAHEEAGINLTEKNIKELGFTEDYFEKESKHYITCFFHCEIDKKSINPALKEPDKFDSEWEWFSCDKLPSPLFIPVINAIKKFNDLIFPPRMLSIAHHNTHDVKLEDSTKETEENIWDSKFRSGFWSNAATGKGPFKNPINFQDPVNTTEFTKHVQKADPVLDFGCGYGRVTNILYQAGYKNIKGIDFSDDMITRGKKEYPYLENNLFSLANDYKKLPFEDNSFSAITVFTVLNAIPYQSELIDLFNEFRRILKPQGILYIYEFTLTNFERDVSRYKKFQEEHKAQNCPYGMFKITSGAIIRHFKKEDIEELMHDFKVLWHHEEQFVSMNGNPCMHGQWISQHTLKQKNM